MKNKLFFITVSMLLFSCSEKPEEIAKENTPLEIESLFLNVTDSIDKTESLTHFQYQNKTVWGGIEVWYLDNEIVKTEATQRGEMGSIETTHFYEEGSNYKSIEIKHLANWKEFNENYGEIDAVGDDRMTYTDDTTETVTHYSYLDSFDLKMIHEASELFIFISNENKITP
jgi:hypothetical protein